MSGATGRVLAGFRSENGLGRKDRARVHTFGCMPHPLIASCDTLEAYLTRVIEPAATVAAVPLGVTAWQTKDPVPYAAAAGQQYQPVALGWQWGPAWSTCWFKLTGTVPAEWAGKPVHLAFDSETEGLLFANGVPHHGFDPNRDLAPVLSRASGGEAVELMVEAACNHQFGAVGLNWDPADVKRRWLSPTPGRLQRAELVVRDPVVGELVWAWQFAIGVIRELCPPAPPMFTPAAPWAQDQPMFQSGRASQLHESLLRAVRQIKGRDPAAVRAHAPAVLEGLLGALRRTPGETAMVGHAVGHAHIDTAWLWPLRETRRKCQRTFSNVLRVMEQDPSFTFMASSAQHYAMVEDDAPALFAQIRQRAAEGRWEPIGEMWVEPDCLITSPESLIRQILHGSRWFDARFGKRSGPKSLFLPDTFGFSGVIPQICRLSGIGTFITNKMAWNDTTPYPHTTFRWRGVDGSEVLTHFTPNHDYNATNSPRELMRAERCHRSKQVARPVFSGEEKPHGARFLNPYGFGDGGGGPTAQQAYYANLAKRCDGLPSVRPSGGKEFLAALHEDVRLMEAAGGQVPVHDGELYLQAHRGCLTTQAWLKRAMRECEDLLRQAEMLDVLHALHCGTRVSAAHGLDRAWKTLLTNQFHDILPGSSIGWVYADAREQMATVRAAAEAVISEAMTGLAGKLGTGELAEPTAVFRGGRYCDSSGVVVLGNAADTAAADDDDFVSEVTVLHRDDAGRQLTVGCGSRTIEIDALGRIASVQLDGERELLAGPANEAVLYDDVPRMWEAWDIDAEAMQKPEPQVAPATRWEITRADAACVTLEVQRPIGTASVLMQTITMAAANGGEPVIRTRLQWREKQSLLKLSFPIARQAAMARYDCGFGYIERPINPGWPLSRAAVELPHHRYVALVHDNGAVAVINDCKYGSSVRHRTAVEGGGTEIGLSICRGTSYPDPDADQGVHEFAVGLVVTSGTNHFVQAADELCQPVATERVPATGAQAEELPPLCRAEWWLGGSAVQFAACKFAEAEGGETSPRSVIVRLVETAGREEAGELHWHPSVERVEPVMLTEAPIAEVPEGFAHDAATGISQVRFKAFEILTLRATLKA